MARSVQDIISDYQEVVGTTTTFLSQVTELEGRLNNLTQDRLESYDSVLQNVKDLNEQYQAEIEVNKILFQNTVENYKIREKELENNSKSLQQREKLLRLEYELLNISDDEYKKKLKALQLEFDINSARKKGIQEADDLLSKSGFKKADQTLFGDLFKDPAILSARMSEFGKRIGEVVTPTNLLANSLELVYKNTLEMAKVMEASAVGFVKSTGITGEFNDVIMDSTFNLRGFGITGQTAANSLVSGFKGFSEISKEMQKDLIESTALLEAQGITSAKQAQNLQFLTMSFNSSVIEAQNFNNALSNMAVKMKIPVGQLTDDFKEAQPVLSALGGTVEEMGQKFQELESISKGTGLSIQKILDITGKFDTFDSAAQSVGKLNAMLGGPYLSTLEMVSVTDPTKRFELLSDAVKNAAGSYDSLSYYQKKAIASSMGLSDVTELAAIMAGRTDLVGDPFGNLTQDEILKKKEAMKEFQTTTELFKTTMMELAISLRPFLVILKEIGSAFRSAMEFGDGWFGTLFSWGIALYGLSKAIGAVTAATNLWGIVTQFARAQWVPLTIATVALAVLGPDITKVLGGIALALAAVAFMAGKAALATALLTGGLTAVLGAAAMASMNMEGLAGSTIDLNHTIDLPQSRSLTKEVLPDLTNQLGDLDELVLSMPSSINNTSKSMVSMNHQIDAFKTTGPETAKTLTEINSNTQKTIMSSVSNNINNSQAPINTKIELTLDGRKVAETVHNYKVPENSTAGKSVRKMAIPPGELI